MAGARRRPKANSPRVDAPILKSRSEIDAMALPTDGGMLFMMALAFLAVAAALAWLERPRRITA